MLRMMETLEDHDDVQHVYANFDIDEKEIQAAAASQVPQAFVECGGSAHAFTLSPAPPNFRFADGRSRFLVTLSSRLSYDTD